MPLETGTFVEDLVVGNPADADARSAGDDHLRLIKTVLKNTFPGMAGRFNRWQIKAGPAYTAIATDNWSLIEATGALTLNLTAAATLGNGWGVWVYARVGAVTIDPNASEQVNGTTTFVVPIGFAGLLTCDGTKFLAVVSNLLALDAISKTIIDAKGDLITASAADVPERLAVGANGALLIADSAATGGLNWLPPGANGTFPRANSALALKVGYGAPRGLIYGLDTAFNATDAVNDIDIAVGEASSDDAAYVDRLVMELSSALIKRIDAAWVVGTNQGGMDTGTVANDTWYFVWLINRPDTGVTDVLFSLSSTAPTMPTSYTKKRLIGVVRRDTALNRRFNQNEGQFRWQAQIQVLTSGTATTDTAVTITSAIPTAIAKTFMCSGRSNVQPADSSPDAFNRVVVSVASGVDYATIAAISGSAEALGWMIRAGGGITEVPVTGTFNYRNLQSNTVTRDADIWVHGFEMTR